MTVVYPDGTPVLGNTKVAAILALAVPTAPDLSTEIGAVTTVDLSCYLMAGGWNPTGTTSKGTKAARLCTRTQTEAINRTTFTLADLMYVYDPQGADSDPGNEAKELLVEGTTLWLLERLGLDARDDAFAIGDRTRAHHVVLGPQIVSGDRNDENAEFYITQSLAYVNDGPIDGVVVA